MTHVAGQATAEDSPVLHAAIGLAEQIRAASDETESGRRIPPGIAAAKKDAGVFGMAMPRGSGGPELDALTQFRVIEVLAMAEGSAGWCAMIGRDGAYITALLDQGVARTMYPDLLGGHRRGCYDASHPDPFAVMAPHGRNDSEARPGYPACLGNPADTSLRLVITATPGGVEECLRLIAASGDQLDPAALADKCAVRVIGPPLLGGNANSQRAQKPQRGSRIPGGTYPHCRQRSEREE
jgi:hypothetical protein